MSAVEQIASGMRLGSKVGRRVFLYSVWLLCFVTLAGASFSAWRSLDNEKTAQKNRIEETLTKLEPSLYHAAWNINDIGVQIVLDALSSLQGVSKVSFSGEMQNLFSPKEAAVDSEHWSCDELLIENLSNQKVGSGTLPMTELRVCLNYEILTADFITAFLTLVLPQLVGIFITSLGFWWLTQRVILSRISVISSHLQDQELDNPLPALTQDDELGLLDRELLNKTQSLRAERDLTRMIIDNISAGIALTDDGYSLLRTNKAFEELIPALPTDNIRGAHLDEILPEIRELPKNEWTKLENLSANPSNSYIEVYTFDFKMPTKEIGKLFVLRDLTVIKRMERETLHANRMSAIGSVTGGIAHDFNNLLGIISGSVELALMETILPVNTRKLLEKVEYSAARAANLTDKLLTFSRRQNLSESLIIPHEMLENVGELSRPMVGPSMILTLRSETKNAVCADETYLESALINLIINARDAVKAGGVIDVAAEDTVLSGQQMVAFSVTDDGCGIPADIIDKVQEPFFTTKKPGNGTGLGLSMVAGFVEQSGGSLKIESQPGHTKVAIYLPAMAYSKGHNKPKPSSEDYEEASLHGLKVAIIDDEVNFSSVLHAYFETLGANVSCFTGKAEMVERVKQPRFDLYLCDVILVGTTGLEVWNYVQQNDSDSEFIFMSGKVPDELHGTIDKTGAPLISKPFMLSDLLELVQKQLQK